jgi:electron transfer flavoprotein alpha subunit
MAHGRAHAARQNNPAPLSRSPPSSASALTTLQNASHLSLHRVPTQTSTPSTAVLVLAEHRAGALAGATRSAISAATALNAGPVTVLVAGAEPDAAAAATAAAAVEGVQAVALAADASLEHGLAEPVAAVLAAQASALAATHVLAAASSAGRDVLPRAAGLAGREPVTDVVAALDAATFVRPTYAGNARATVRYEDGGARYVSIRAAAFPAAGDRAAGEAAAPVRPADPAALAAARAAPATTWVSDDAGAGGGSAARPDLGSASIVIAGGRALGGPEGFAALGRLADRLGAALGASRAAVDAGWAPNDLQVGQTGRVVAPGLYVAAGISGAIQHLAGMKDSKCIVAINTDAEAPIFQVGAC